MTLSAPVNLADMGTLAMVPCKRCGEMLQKQARFCPLCGRDQSALHGAGGSWLDTADAWLDAVPESGAAGRSEVPPPAAVDIAAAPNPLVVQESPVHAVPGGPAREAANSDFGLVRPIDFRQKEVLEGEGPKRRPGSAVDRSRLVIGLMAVLIVLLLAVLVHDKFFVEKRSEAGRANVAGMSKPRADADPKASQPPEAGEPAARSAQVPVSAQTPAAAAPVPVAGVADPKAKECNEVLTALSLCPKK